MSYGLSLSLAVSCLSLFFFFFCLSPSLCSSLPSNRVFTEGTCKLLNLVISDLVDEDFVLNRRRQAASALLFGMVALVTKPGQTFAPLIGTWLLCFYTGTPRICALVYTGTPSVCVSAYTGTPIVQTVP